MPLWQSYRPALTHDIESTRARILVVEDHPVVAEAISEFLARRGHQFVREQSPDVAIIDYMLPDGNGLEALPTSSRADANRAPSEFLLEIAPAPER